SMASIIGLVVLFLATLTLGGCAGMPNLAGLMNGQGSGYGNGYGGSYGQPYGQPYGAPMGVPVPMDPGYATAAPAGVYAPQPQPYYAPQQPYADNYNGANVYAPAQPGPMGGPWVDQRERDQAARIHQGLRDGSLTPREAQRLQAEQRHIRGAEGRMRADGNLNPNERARLNAMQNRANRDIYGARHNGVVQPGAHGFQPGNGPLGPTAGSMVRPGAPRHQPNGPVGPMGQPQINGAQMQGPGQPQMRPMQPQARPVQSGSAPRARRTAATPGG
ncbi:MAG: hypothetical protein NTW80_04200, partial [Deltaproteobacteria bacterium]|nr:hypothetical protein [Deltaproteobacteria bacterium]